MTNLTIIVDEQGVTAAEVYCGDCIKYVETFATWAKLIDRIGHYFDSYVWIEIRRA
jgi:hypothetical protein